MENPIIDSNMTFEEALSGLEFPKEIRDKLSFIDVQYISFDDQVHQGQLVLDSTIAGAVEEIFGELLILKFPIEKVIPMTTYGWSDGDSMEDNNSSAFNYRVIYGTDRLSNHSFGCAVDINPKLNPYVIEDGTTFPANASYDSSKPGTITKECGVVELFTERGFEWGGNWKTKKDWQHFDKIDK